jgi:hypothetical protein
MLSKQGYCFVVAALLHWGGRKHLLGRDLRLEFAATKHPAKIHKRVTSASPGDDQAYRRAFDKLVEVVRMLHDRGVFIVFGTDTGGSFTYHREMELYQLAGMTLAEILKRARTSRRKNEIFWSRWSWHNVRRGSSRSWASDRCRKERGSGFADRLRVGLPRFDAPGIMPP